MSTCLLIVELSESVLHTLCRGAFRLSSLHCRLISLVLVSSYFLPLLLFYTATFVYLYTHHVFLLVDSHLTEPAVSKQASHTLISALQTILDLTVLAR